MKARTLGNTNPQKAKHPGSGRQTVELPLKRLEESSNDGEKTVLLPVWSGDHQEPQDWLEGPQRKTVFPAA